MKILIIEDEVAIREVEAAYLTSAGYEVSEVANGTQAVELMRRDSFDLAVVDLNLPGMDGLEVCREVRMFSAVPLLIVTARNNDEEEIRGLEAGADDFLRKPFNPNVLVVRVHNLLRRHGTKPLRLKGLVIDPATMIVKVGERRVTLTKTLLNLLVALASQPNVVLSRSQLVGKIYDNPTDHLVYERTIDAHIKLLRKHIEHDAHQPRIIETVIGVGYRFREPTND